jgi:HAD superfamily hydrolase (TIGR01509 family)
VEAKLVPCPPTRSNQRGTGSEREVLQRHSGDRRLALYQGRSILPGLQKVWKRIFSEERFTGSMGRKRQTTPRLVDVAAVVFDLDGVLVDSEPLHFSAANRVLARYGSAISEPEYIRFIGLGEATTWEAWKERFGLPDTVATLVAAHTQARLAQIAAGVTVIADAVAAARLLHATGMALAIASSSTTEVIDALLRAIGLDTAFPVRVSGEDEQVRRSKPAPDVYLAAAARLNVPPRHCLAIEDSGPGVLAATRAGMACIAVPNRWTCTQDFSQADVVVESLRYLPLLLL